MEPEEARWASEAARCVADCVDWSWQSWEADVAVRWFSRSILQVGQVGWGRRSGEIKGNWREAGRGQWWERERVQHEHWICMCAQQRGQPRGCCKLLSGKIHVPDDTPDLLVILEHVQTQMKVLALYL